MAFVSAALCSLAGGMAYAVIRSEVSRAFEPDSAVRQLLRMMRHD